MILPVVKYGHPVLRQKGAAIEKITPEIKKLIADMFETMREKNGVGLAAQQVGRALQLTVIDVREVGKERPSTLELKGKFVDVNKFMPMVLINPEIRLSGEFVESGEGCLSFPEIFAEISRPAFVDVKAMDKNFKPIKFRAGELLSRAIQHEWDHLNGFLFIDRMHKMVKQKIQKQLDELHAKTKAELERNK